MEMKIPSGLHNFEYPHNHVIFKLKYQDVQQVLFCFV